MKFNTLHSTLILSLSFLLLVAGCGKTSLEEIPSYLKIDTISISTTSSQGTASQNVSDAWVYADNELIGAFELPAKVPVLRSGSSVLSVFAGIKLNGINETRVQYPFYEQIRKTVTFERETITELGHMKFAYVEGTKFAWKENFEQGNLSLDPTARSEVNFVRTALPELATAFPYETNEYAAKVVIAADTLVFECVSHDSFELPTSGTSVFLELNYKSNNPFTVGLFVNSTVTSQRSVLVVNPSSTWNKIYINFTPTVTNYPDANSFSVFFTAMKSTKDETAEILFDNIKLLHF